MPELNLVEIPEETTEKNPEESLGDILYEFSRKIIKISKEISWITSEGFQE